jgi:metallo-beta-lactamase family protein
MEIIAFGAAKEVTGSCFSIATEKEKILIDCGLFQGNKEMIRMNYEDFEFNPQKYSALILTHAHLDHCGRIPKLVKYGFRGKIFCTDATKALAEIVMRDSAKIAAEDTNHENKRRAKQGLPPRKPLYNDIDVNNSMKLFRVFNYDEEFKITKNISAVFYDAGHILGASSVQIKILEREKENVLVFSGDLGQKGAVLVKKTEPIEKADYVFIESTYGDRLHPSIDERGKELTRVINETYKRKGKLMIPSFAVERTQEILYWIKNLMAKNLIPRQRVYLDSPMALKATEVFIRYPEHYNETVKKTIHDNENPFEFPELVKTQSVDESKKINSENGPFIIIAGNGMCTGGRIKHHIRNNIEDPKNTLLFIGYQTKGTLGYWIKKGEKQIRLLGDSKRVNAKIETIEGFSAHADYNDLIKWLKNFSPKPKKVYIIHGDEEESRAFFKKIVKEDFKAYIPSLNEKIII